MRKKDNDDNRSKLDDIDRRIIDAMAFHARISNAALAKKVGLSESATLERVRRLEKSDVILGYSTRFNPEALDHNVTALVTIRMVSHNAKLHDSFVDAIMSMEEILSCFQVMGSCDFVAHVAAKDVDGLERFLTQKLLAIEAVDRTESMFVLKIVKKVFDPPTDGAQ